MPYTCKRCQQHFPRALRVEGACPHCGVAFETAELTALCIGLTLSFLLALVLPELGRALLHPGSWSGPSDTVVLVRAALVTVVFAAGVLFLSAKYALWQGAALTAHPRLRLLWLAALPGAVFAGLVLVVGVAFVALKHRQPPRRSLTVFLAER